VVTQTTLQWIDRTAGVAYVTVRQPLIAFREFLDAIDALIAHPDWHPGMPVIEDLREASITPPANCQTEWRAYVAARGPLLGGCRWAVVTEARHAPLTPVLETAAADAAGAVSLQRFSNMVDAHEWAMGSCSVNKIQAWLLVLLCPLSGA
jgi:hypothetical protein